MVIIGFSFSKMTVQHTKNVKSGVKIQTNIRINSVEKTTLAFDDKREAIKSSFVYTVVYDAEVGSVELVGEILSMHDKKDAEALLVTWKKDKSLPQQVMGMLLNHIMQKCSMQALILAKDVGLPSPIPLPKIGKQPTKKTAKKS